jgi:hypothetical protein
MEKYKVIITKVAVCEIEIEAGCTDEAVEKLRESHEKAGQRVKTFRTQELRAEIHHVFSADDEGRTMKVRDVKLI